MSHTRFTLAKAIFFKRQKSIKKSESHLPKVQISEGMFRVWPPKGEVLLRRQLSQRTSDRRLGSKTYWAKRGQSVSWAQVFKCLGVFRGNSGSASLSLPLPPLALKKFDSLFTAVACRYVPSPSHPAFFLSCHSLNAQYSSPLIGRKPAPTLAFSLPLYLASSSFGWW